MDWIDIKNKNVMPEEGSRYWVTVHNLMFRDETIMEAEYKNGEWFSYNHLRVNIIAWYPVKKPEPYKPNKKSTRPKERSLNYLLENIDSDKLIDSTNEWLQSYEKKRKIVKSDTYKNWLYDYVTEVGSFCDDSLLYEEENDNRDNSLLLSYFMNHIEELGAPAYYDDDGWEHYVFKIKDKYFDICTIAGQGAFTVVKECEANKKAILL